MGEDGPTALVWLRGGVVNRVLVNIDGASPDVREKLNTLYGGSPEDSGPSGRPSGPGRPGQIWKLDGGENTARLDLVVAMSLVLEAAGTGTTRTPEATDTPTRGHAR